jgi:hypothetical protein
MKATLEFNLPEEREEFEIALRAGKLQAALSEFENFLRAQLKYGELPEAEYKRVEMIREKYFELIGE